MLIIASTIGFVVFVRMGSTFLEAFQYAEQKMAGLVIIIVLGWLLVSVLVGFAGIVFVGLGFAFGRWGQNQQPQPRFHSQLRQHQPSQHD